MLYEEERDKTDPKEFINSIVLMSLETSHTQFTIPPSAGLGYNLSMLVVGLIFETVAGTPILAFITFKVKPSTNPKNPSSSSSIVVQ